MRKINIGILFGGKSVEHEVSLRSAKNIINAIDKEKYNIILILINKAGKWLVKTDSNLLLKNQKGKIRLGGKTDYVAIIPQSNGKILNFSSPKSNQIVDVVFPILHGPFGEDGTVQGLLKLANIPFVGAGVLGSAVGMDKDVMKRLLRDADIPVAQFLTFKDCDNLSFNKIARKLGLPFFVKPANLGSSVGISKVKNKKDFAEAVKEAFKYDRKIIIEEYIDGRELECSVLGNDNPIASVPGEVIVKHDFYSYEAKYLDENGAVLEIPAKIPARLAKEIQKLAVKTFKISGCEGLGRVDLFLKKDGQIIVNEINTIPGFTSISMYPRLWEASGIGYTKLIDKLIQFAIERFKKEQKLKTIK
ncbi:MAG: D-alanine--D-alanine ligase [Patescibacteria group bacterium]